MEEAGAIQRTRLEPGIRVVTEPLPGLRSVAVGFWVGSGARDEDDERFGASHFLEHLLFKGTATRSAPEIAEAVESVGGDMNAFTTHEYTAFYVRVPDDHLGLAVDILSDVVWAPALRADEMDAERQVILEEIRMRDDAPDEVVHELVAAALFPRHPLGRAVLGSHESIGGMARDIVAGYHDVHYRPGNVVVAAAGNLEHGRVVEMIDERLGRPSPAFRASRSSTTAMDPPEPLTVLHRPTEQVHLALGLRALPRDDPDRYALTVLNQVLGGGMSSRLFQEVREQRGLAYSVYSYRNAYEETGALVVYAGTTPGRADEVLAVLAGALDRLVADGGVSDRELDAAKGHLKGSMALALESSASRMHRIGRSELTQGEVPTLDELVAEIDAVDAEGVARVIDRVVAERERALAVVGPFDDGAFAARVA